MPLKGPEGTDQLLMSVNETGINLTVQRIQGASLPLGGTFQIHLPNVVIPGKLELWHLLPQTKGLAKIYHITHPEN